MQKFRNYLILMERAAKSPTTLCPLSKCQRVSMIARRRWPLMTFRAAFAIKDPDGCSVCVCVCLCRWRRQAWAAGGLPP